MNRVTLLGVPIDAVSMAEAVARIRTLLVGETQHHVMTPNNEMLVQAYHDASFRALLNRTALNVPDSTGLLWAARWTEKRLPERVTGVDTVQALCMELDETTPVFFLGASEGVAERAAEMLRMSNARLRIAGAYAGSPNEVDVQEIVRRINASGASLLFVAYGSPSQDQWIAAHLHAMPSVRVAMGVGGTFDFLAGTQRRAPLWMRNLGLEWLYRFIKQPSRWRRIWNAVVVFPLLVITQPALSSSKGGASPPR